MKLKYVIGRKWSCEILFLLDEKDHTFSELMERLQISSRILTNRLNELKREGLIVRTLQENRTTIYSLSGKGKQIVELIRKIEELLKQ
jgi:DNA-binding HxlR family transcriptional regulator